MHKGDDFNKEPAKSDDLKEDDLKKETARVGLCASCQHVQPVKSDRGSEFYRCGKAGSDPRFAKYPRLPVLQCAGYEAVASSR